MGFEWFVFTRVILFTERFLQDEAIGFAQLGRIAFGGWAIGFAKL